MKKRLIHTATALALATLSTLALAQAPARVGRIALSQGNVTIAGDVGAASEAALLNYPVTSNNTITTAQGARTELRIGSTSIRLDADSSLEVDQLDDERLVLRLNYGSASVRIVDASLLAGFEISTPQALLRMREPGRMRIDAERRRDTTSVTVFDGVGLVDAAGGTLPLRAGKRADVMGDDIDTGTASRDSFDDWALGRDQYQDRSTSARYVTSDMTGYEDLDRYGAWSQDTEYGAVWTPQVSSSWVPYGDGRWTWLDPWGWTWVDNAPWGYAPFHYGRWVQVNRRWSWAPGRHDGRPVWAPALVGWVGGNVAYGGRPQLSQGWYPLSPRERYVPGYRASQDHISRLNFGPRGPDSRRDEDQRRRGLTVLPQGQFGQRGQVVVPRQGGVRGAVLEAGALAAMQPPRPAQAINRLEGRGEYRGDNRRRDEGGLGGAVRGAAIEVRGTPPAQNNQFNPQPREPVTIATPPPQLPGTNTPRAPVMPNLPPPRQPVTILTPTPVMPIQNQNLPQRFENRDHDRRNDDRNGRNDDRGGRPQFQQPQPQQPQQQRPPQAQPVQQPVQQAAPQPAPVAQAPRNDGGGMAGMLRGAARDARQQAQPPQQAQPQPQRAAPPAAVAPPPARAERGGEGRGDGRTQQER
ncbi:DUF6600 domain-containing protein [Massilia sp. S19_KUP03_FR1]|uniref:DUF6600 domain-containing protein n=1 Tax=Massilia sp. S19_KUP03_FR1 TaxID=3025503 RepID=UPI002FCDB6CC